MERTNAGVPIADTVSFQWTNTAHRADIVFIVERNEVFVVPITVEQNPEVEKGAAQLRRRKGRTAEAVKASSLVDATIGLPGGQGSHSLFRIAAGISGGKRWNDNDRPGRLSV
jgi:hypothetical protein